MFKFRLRSLLPALTIMAGACGMVSGQEFPSRPVGIIAAGPGGSSDIVVTRLAQESARVLSQPDVRQKYLNGGAEPAGSSPEALTVAIKSEMARMAKVIKQAGIRGEQ